MLCVVIMHAYLSVESSAHGCQAWPPSSQTPPSGETVLVKSITAINTDVWGRPHTNSFIHASALSGWCMTCSLHKATHDFIHSFNKDIWQQSSGLSASTQQESEVHHHQLKQTQERRPYRRKRDQCVVCVDCAQKQNSKAKCMCAILSFDEVSYTFVL